MCIFMYINVDLKQFEGFGRLYVPKVRVEQDRDMGPISETRTYETPFYLCPIRRP